MRLPTHSRSKSLDLQMTAMIDVVFLLLVFFLWTSSFDEPEFDLSSDLALPSIGNSKPSSPAAPVPFDEIVVRIVQAERGQQELRLNSSTMPDLAELKTRLAAIANIGAQPAVIVHPDAPVPMETAIAVYDLARAAGFDRVLFTVSP